MLYLILLLIVLFDFIFILLALGRHALGLLYLRFLLDRLNYKVLIGFFLYLRLFGRLLEERTAFSRASLAEHECVVISSLRLSE